MPNYKDQNNQIHHLDYAEDAAKYLPQGCVEITDQEADAIRLAAITVPTQAEIQQSLLAKLDEHINSTAKARGYDNRVTCTMRAGYLNPWQQEGIAFGQWMDACYVLAYQIQAEVVAGTRPVPTAEELVAAMPLMVWPV